MAADLYLYTRPDQRTWMATVADGTAEIPDSTVATTLREATGQWQWVIVTADELVYASTSQPAARHDWQAALAGMGDAADNDALVIETTTPCVLDYAAPTPVRLYIVRIFKTPAG